jgi:predicted DNA-binding transcriptional regulator AlpA
MKTLLTSNQLCEHLQVSRPYLLECRKEGLPTIPLGVRQFRYDFDEVIAWLKANKVKNDWRERA